MRNIWKEYFKNLYNIDTHEKVCAFDRVQKGKYFGGDPIKRIEVEVRMGKIKNGKSAGKDEVMREMA